ncbi:hypothetical protein IWZ00DRAFT_119703 [Phyllosticta capitalensis]
MDGRVSLLQSLSINVAAHFATRHLFVSFLPYSACCIAAAALSSFCLFLLPPPRTCTGQSSTHNSTAAPWVATSDTNGQRGARNSIGHRHVVFACSTETSMAQTRDCRAQGFLGWMTGRRERWEKRTCAWRKGLVFPFETTRRSTTHSIIPPAYFAAMPFRRSRWRQHPPPRVPLPRSLAPHSLCLASDSWITHTTALAVGWTKRKNYARARYRWHWRTLGWRKGTDNHHHHHHHHHRSITHCLFTPPWLISQARSGQTRPRRV